MAPEFSVRSESVDVEQIMKQIRQRIRDKRGVDYTEDEIRELASVKLEKFLDPSRVRSELLTYYRQARSAPAGTLIPEAPPNYVFEDETPYASSPGAGGRAIRLVRRLLNPLLKFFINPNPIIHVLNMQGQINAQNTRRIDHLLVAEQLNFEIIHNLVVEMTRLAIEVKNLKMRVESLSGRLDFNERRARALESVVQYKPGSGPAAETARGAAQAPVRSVAQPAAQHGGGQAPRGNGEAPAQPQPQGQAPGGGVKGEAQRARRRRRRRGRGGAGGPQAGGAPEAGEPRADAESGADELNFDDAAGSDAPRSGDVAGSDAPRSEDTAGSHAPRSGDAAGSDAPRSGDAAGSDAPRPDEGGREESRGSAAAGPDEPVGQ
jgi:hypothetical protein